MLHRILVPLDGSTEAEKILAPLQRLAAVRGEVHFLHVVPEVHGPVGVDPTHRLVFHEEGARYLTRTREKWLPQQPGLDLVRAGNPAESILAAALEKNIDLIAMTTHGRSGLKRFFLGSVAENVVRETQLPVLLTRPDVLGPGRPIQRVLLAVDASQTPKDLLETLKGLLSPSKTELILFHAEPAVRDPAPLWASPLQLRSHSPAESHLMSLADSLEKEGYSAWPELSSGDPGESILEEAKRSEADLIALSTHGRQGLERFLEGSIAERVVHGSPVPVLLQKPLVRRRLP